MNVAEISPAPRLRWDIFCKVVDNFGDIGVCWRLARCLKRDCRQQVRLWVDDLEAFHRLCPSADPQRQNFVVDGVEVRRWCEVFPLRPDVGDVVIEAFACELPEAFVDAMAESGSRRLWINLEYLSAETWVEDCHLMRSPHPRLPLVKYFCFPGFSTRTGGLLRERGLFDERDAFQNDPAAQDAFFRRLGFAVPAARALLISLFAYEQPTLPTLLQQWSAAPTPVVLLVPEGRILPEVAAFFGKTSVEPGDCLSSGSLTVRVLPFLAQADYDRLLWACDLNFVRGEDSFVRAQWAARPLVWQLYPQQDGAHLVKLEAFLERFTAGLDQGAARALRRFWQAWNRGQCCEHLWPTYAAVLPQLSRHAGRWADALAERDDLAASLVKFCQKRVE